MGQVRLRVDDNTPGPVDKARVGVTHTVLIAQDRKAVIAYLFHLHRDMLLIKVEGITIATKIPVTAPITAIFRIVPFHETDVQVHEKATGLARNFGM
jgi:hypothetical protein